MRSPTPRVTLTRMQSGTEPCDALARPLHLVNRPVRVLAASRTLAILNVVAVGTSLAAFVGGLLSEILAPQIGTTAGIALPTCAFGLLWAALLRVPRTVGTTGIRWGWLASVPIAYANCAVAIAFCVSHELEPFSRVLGALLLALFGTLVWVPALGLTLLCFGLPLAWAERLAKQGLAGSERGEMWVGSISASLCFAAAWLLPHALARSAGDPPDLLIRVLALAGALTGGLSAALSILRAGRRRLFVASAEAGRVPGYRVEPTPAGKRLLRVTAHGEGYRVADDEEEILFEAAPTALTPPALAPRR
jgi:hypothetical protein